MLDLHMETLENIEAPEWSAGEVIGGVVAGFVGGLLVGLAVGAIVT